MQEQRIQVYADREIKQMNPVDIIIRKRDGQTLSPDEIRFFVDGYTAGAIPDYQAAAWAMAIYFQGMTPAETTDLTMAMAASGDQLDLHDSLPPGTVIVDKHSSGGVGDKTTLAVGPIVAACGLPVGKMSGRGLSFTGGTIDKLESISGWSADLSEAQFRRQLGEIGLVVAGQTAQLAPADKQLYALRDVTGTVPSLPLIASSIMSKKLAAGADAIVLDVKCGQGAFMESLDDAHALATLMVEIGTRAGRRVEALITQMDQPLGAAVGHALEVEEAIATLHGQGPNDFQRLVEIVAAAMLTLGQPHGNVLSHDAAVVAVKNAIASGAAFAKFVEFVAAQGGDVRLVQEPDRLAHAPIRLPVPAPRAGHVHHIDAREVGLAVVDLGGGRRVKGDPIEHCVGAVLENKVGAAVERGDTLCTIHAVDATKAEAAVVRVRNAYRIIDEPAAPLPILYDRVAAT